MLNITASVQGKIGRSKRSLKFQCGRPKFWPSGLGYASIVHDSTAPFGKMCFISPILRICSLDGKRIMKQPLPSVFAMVRNHAQPRAAPYTAMITPGPCQTFVSYTNIAYLLAKRKRNHGEAPAKCFCHGALPRPTPGGTLHSHDRPMRMHFILS